MPGARGSAFPIRKKTSHVHLVLEAKVGKVKATKAEKAAKKASSVKAK
jgi:hypothetical protein